MPTSAVGHSRRTPDQRWLQIRFIVAEARATSSCKPDALIGSRLNGSRIKHRPTADKGVWVLGGWGAGVVQCQQAGKQTRFLSPAK